MSPQAIVAGHLCLDITPQFLYDSLPPPGQVTHVGAAVFSTGGAASNTGLDMIRLGIDTLLCARVGDDSLAQSVRDILERQAPGSSLGLLAAPGDDTSYTIILSPVGKDRSFLHFSGANDSFSSADIPADALAQARLLHLGYPPSLRRLYADNGRDLIDLYRRARQAGATTSLDLCMLDPDSDNSQVDWRDVLERVMPFVDLFLPSAPELLLMYDPAGYRRLAERGDVADLIAEGQLAEVAAWALSMGAKAAMIKLSKRGIYLRTASAAAMAAMGRAAAGERGRLDQPRAVGGAVRGAECRNNHRRR